MNNKTYKSSKPDNFKQKSVKPKRRLKSGESSKRFNYKLPDWILDHKVAPPEVSTFTVGVLLKSLDLEVSEDHLSKLLDHLFLVKEFNNDINLVSRSRVDGVLLQSLWESIVPVKKFDWSNTKTALDLGTGGGFPGMPISILLPELKMTLIDSRRAKTLALKSIIKDTSLSNVTVVHERAETFCEHHDEKFDLVTMKSVGLIKEAIPWVEPMISSKGIFLVWKGPEGLREFQSVDSSKWKILNTISILPHRYVYVLQFQG